MKNKQLSEDISDRDKQIKELRNEVIELRSNLASMEKSL